ncbi:MAG: ABC transporter permease [Acidobacteriota bacterium]
MNKLFAVFKREYIQAVRKKMFIIMTILLPLLIAAVFILPSMMMMSGMGEKKISVIDGTGRLQGAFAHSDEAKAASKSKSEGADVLKRRDLPGSMKITWVDSSKDANLDDASRSYLSRLSDSEKSARIDGVLIIPHDAFTSPEARLKFYSRSSTDFISQERLGGMTNRAIQRQRLGGRGLSEKEIDQLTTTVPLDSVQVSKTGEQKKGGAANLFIGIIFTALLMMPSLVYGLEIMRGIIQEKNDRVVELLISSMTPTQLLTGKILGIAAVGLTQITAWLLIGMGVAVFGVGSAMAAGVDVMQFLHFSTFVYFLVFFILAYLTYVCVYAIGGAVCNSDKEAQQLIAPITMTMMLPWFMIGALITSPDSPFVVALSMLPVFGPLTMFVRTLISEPPMSQVLITIAVSIATVAAFFWATAKIFRVGILSYGKRPTIPELWRWLKVA